MLAAKSTRATDAAVRDNALLSASTTTPSGRRISTRKKPVTLSAQTPGAPSVSKPKAKNRLKKQKQKQPLISTVVDSSDDESPERIVDHLPPVKKADLKTTPQKAENVKIKDLENAVSMLQSELTGTRRLLEEFVRSASDGKTSAPNLPPEKPKDQLATQFTISEKTENENPTVIPRIDYSTFPGSCNTLAIHMLDFHERERMSRQAIQLANRNARDMEAELIQGRKDYHDLHMLLMKNLAERR